MKPIDLIRARIEAFICDYAEWNSKFYNRGDLDFPDLSKAQKAFKPISSRHFTPDNETAHGLGMSLGWPPEHLPENEEITGITKLSDLEVLVDTSSKQGIKQYFEYRIRKVGGKWLIHHVTTLSSGKQDKVKDLDLKTLARRRYKPVLVSDIPAGLASLFVGPTRLRTIRGVTATKVMHVGTISAPSGFITGDDPGNWQRGAEVFEMPIPAGHHEIELVTDRKLGIVGAARIVFHQHKTKSSFARATRKAPNTISTAQSHVIGIDGGILGVADAGAILSLSPRERERLYQRLASASGQRGACGAVSVPLDDSTVAWAIRSGCGDGGYPAFWQLDANGKPQSLIFDFMDLSQAIWETVRVPLPTNDTNLCAYSKALKQHGVAFRFGQERGSAFLTVRSKTSTSTKVFDSQGHLAFDSEAHGCSVCGDETTYHFPKELFRFGLRELELRIYQGHRYEIITDTHR